MHQSVLRHIKRVIYRTPVCQPGVTLLRTNPAQFSTVAPDGQFGLPLVYHLKRFGPIIICGAVYLAFLVCSAVISRAAISSVEPHFKHFAILGEQFFKLITEISNVFGACILGVVTVPRRQVHGKFQPILLTSIGQFAHHVALSVFPRRVFHRELGVFRWP